ncbi:MAG: adenylate kinase [Bacteroidota bacterium]
MLNIVIFGPPGAGKGTQAEKIAKKYQLIHLSTGDIFRANIKGGTELGRQAKGFMDKGELVPDEVTISMLEFDVSKNLDAKGFIFDGFPRTIAQADKLDEFLSTKNLSITMTLSLEVEDEELIKRILLRGQTSGRSDDVDKTIIGNRINEYNKKTSPLKEFYAKQGKLKSIKGVGGIENIFVNLCEAIEKK